MVDAFANMPSRSLTIVGDGVLRAKLRRRATPNITFMHNVNDNQLAELYSTSKALIMPQREDFGYTSLEAQSCGCPVIAFGRGGATTTVIHGATGIFFDAQSVSAIKKALDSYEENEYAMRRSLGEHAKKHLSQFSTKKFKSKFTTLLA
ncbi:MAG: GDP-mannose-dependent alpha-(1-6)-phosphatidylinositol monomannoside mannosyltransferase [Microgenomates bacterium OLB23]|nr:MAG: GDP-mannose-dependent alpha-(1-6)-phosphatidylinositol monomannoside mannosyltransferase [Microgenomates bacterium OLB23]